jgi:hypothetical protein
MIKGGILMPYKDPEKQAEYQRNYQREYQRQKRSAKVKPIVKTLNPDDIRSAKGLLDLLTETLAEVSEAEGDVFIKARLKGYLISIGLKCVETAELEERLRILEENSRRSVPH